MLVLRRSSIRQEAQLSKYGGSWLGTTALCINGKGLEREAGSGGGNGLSVEERVIPGTKQQIL